MHILLTNDDGIRAEGILQLAKHAVEKGHRVTICAPDSEKSACSHSINIVKPLHARESELFGMRAIAVDGTPTDCARLGVFLLRDDKPDICISGINKGSNLGGACVYSGTVGAAMEASMAGCPAIAASLRSFTQKDYTAAAEITLRVAEWALKHPLRRGEIYNLNVPALPLDKIKGIKSTQALAPVYLTEARYESYKSEYGHTYYFLCDGAESAPYPENSDDVLNENGWATVSALTWDTAVKRDVDEVDLTI
ncbi:MAG: 5'/3'-nucleotidase SurE [Clostridia bacterium]|nr:5'/3'-nucleotidase SurE [Clostridia bacterium]